MSYVVLARKYRPQTFEDVVGQNATSQTLLNALESGRVAHAYIFSGPRGVGKTTTARILAKCLNCEKGPTKSPCNQCETCRSITLSSSTDDVLEIDGASNRGIEQIRELRDSAKYAPARSRYRIYIIDEAHQITKDAFGALLKTLEEPPAHVVFMMATTDVQKIPAPILSRCQRFTLKPITAPSVFEHLKRICQQEKVKVEDAALADIVRFVEGSMRDALSLLDQAIVFAPEGIQSATVRELLGRLPLDLIRDTVKAIKEGDPAVILKQLNEAAQKGADVGQLAKDLQSYYHHLLLLKAGVEDSFEAPPPEVRADAASLDFPTLERNIRLLARAMDDMRHSETPRAIFEVYALRLGQHVLDAREILRRLEELEKSPPAVAPMKSASAAPAFSPSPLPPRPKEKTFSSPPAPLRAASPVAATGHVPPAAAISLEEIAAQWESLQQRILQAKPTLVGALADAQASVAADALKLSFGKAFHADMAQRALEVIQHEISKIAGRSIAILIDTVPPPLRPAPTEAPPSTRPPEPLSASEDVEEIPAQEAPASVQQALKHFPGTVKRHKKSNDSL